MMTKDEKLKYLMNKTGKGQIACDICLQLSGGDVDKAIERMKMSYPSMVVK